MIPPRTTTTLIAEITGNVADEPLIQQKNSRTFGSDGVEAGGRIVMGTATTAGVLVKDSTGKILHNATITQNTDIASAASGVKGPLTVTVTSISNAAHTLTVYWWVKK